MARKTKSRTGRDTGTGGDSTQAIRDSAQKIWLAGLGAFERAKTEGPRMFETLVEQGRNMGARAVGAADEALKQMRQANYSGATQKLEKVFEERVSKSLSRLGVMTSQQVDALQRQVASLNEAVRRMSGMEQPARGRKAGGRKAGAGKAGGRKKAASKASRATTGTRKRAASSRKRTAKTKA